MNEYVDVLDELTGKRTRIVKSRNKVHKDGEWYLNVHFWCGKMIMC